MEIIPAIDIIDGRCVRLEKGDYSKKKEYSADPVEVALMFESWGIKRLHLVDLDGARSKKIVNLKVLTGIASATSLVIDFGGGLRTRDDVRTVFDSGASMITGGSIAVKEPDVFTGWLDEFGSDRIILGADHRSEKISVSGWFEDSGTGLFPFLEKYISLGIKKVICTDIDKDGMLEGPSVQLYTKMINRWPGLHLVASGGVGQPSDLDLLESAGVPAVIIGKAIYEGRITQKDLAPFLSQNS